MTTVVNIRAEPCNVLIDRSTVYGNAFRIGPDGNRQSVIEMHEALWRRRLASPTRGPAALELLRALKGKRLGCHCKPLPCHGDNYVKLIAEFFP